MKTKHKRLSTFTRTGQVLQPGTTIPRDLTGYYPRATMAFENSATTDLVISLEPETGEWTVTAAPSEQVTWPLGEARWDAIFYNPTTDDSVATETFRVEIERQIADLPEIDG